MLRYLLLFMCLGMWACSDFSGPSAVENASSAEWPAVTDLTFPLFSEVDPALSGIDFKNRIVESDAINYFQYEYLYNGGGIAVGDINNDGLPDLFFTANMSFDRLYLNKGDWQFEDISKTAGIRTQNDWSTGVTMADVNGDGWLDIYVSKSGWFEQEELRRNRLWINNGDLTFSEQAQQYRIADAGYSTQAVFFDLDNDNDLDLYVGNHPIVFKESLQVALAKRATPPAYQSDQLYRNDGKQFINISQQAGIRNYGHTLGLVANDFNRDGHIDIFVSNDYNAPNFYYQNQGDGTFVDQGPQLLKHMAKFSMGVDAADINNDGWTDIFTTEMMAEDNQRQKTNMASMSVDDFWTFVEHDYGHQYMHNCLQLNNGQGPFSEIAYLAGVATTDWSWAPLFADFNQDGYQD
ncbi:MAG: VCBS repeat-containing protein, partial [Bacteroidota bacterium]